MKKKNFISMSLMVGIMVGVMVLASGCSAFKKAGGEPADDPFFEKARLIMTPEEVDIYKHLPDQKSKEDFIEDFWNKRDPDPTSPENANKEEFEQRIAYANRWFNEGSKGRGWDTERGRILLLLGFPDERVFGEAGDATSSGRLLSTKRYPTEVWRYYRWGGMTLMFADNDDTGRLRLQYIPSNLQTAMDFSRFSLDLRDKAGLKNAFKFEADYRNGKLTIRVPSQKISFNETDGKMDADFGITVYVYLDSVKTDTLKDSKSIQLTRDEALNTKYIEFAIPYQVQKSGKYYFDILIEDQNSSKTYRNFVSYKK
ncbi:MAG: GWxTD domain-containing protein [Candidatus Omnitrophota bacterium]